MFCHLKESNEKKVVDIFLKTKDMAYVKILMSLNQ